MPSDNGVPLRIGDVSVSTICILLLATALIILWWFFSSVRHKTLLPESLITIDAHGPMTLSLLYEEPCIRLINGFVTDEEAEYIILTYKSILDRSTVSGDTLDEETNESRTSSSAFLPAGMDDPVLQKIENRASLLTGIPVSHWETMQLTHYKPGQEYKPHFDWFNDSDNNRTCTIFAYLNDVGDDEGGETEFTKLNLYIKPKRGAAVIWNNCAARGKEVVCETFTEHAGLPPKKGEKYGLNLWARTDRYRAP